MKHALLVAWITVHSLDAGTTHYALSHGARETVIPTQNKWVIDGVIGASATLTWVGLERLKEGHPKLATALKLIVIGTHVIAVSRNVHELRK